MTITELALPGVLLIEGSVFRDERGTFRETWRDQRYDELGIATKFVQDNVSTSKHGVLRGLHMQQPHAQAKLVTVLHGEVYDVCVDLRPDSPAFRRWLGVHLSGSGGPQLYIPRGFAHGFVVTAESAVVSYKCDEYYHADSEITLLWNDPDIGIDWPVRDPIVSDKDRHGRRASEIAQKLTA